MSESFGCAVPFRINSDRIGERNRAMEILLSIAGILECHDISNRKKFYLGDEFSVGVNDNKHDIVPRYYFSERIHTYYFNFCIKYYSRHFNPEIDSQRVSQILNFLWDKKIPAAVISDSEDFDYALPHKGGNDVDFMFWKDDVEIIDR